jgi:hypothetical protein
MTAKELGVARTIVGGVPPRDLALADTLAGVLEVESRPRGPASDEPSCAQASSDRRYEVLGVLGVGGMGRVYEVRDVALGRSIALKELSAEASSIESARRFLVEALVTANLEHPGVVPVYERGVRDGRPFYTMRRLPGRTLTDALAQAKTDADRLALVPALTRVAETLGYAHARGVVHRDVKPANVVLGDFGEVTVIDWGIAKVGEIQGLGLSVLPTPPPDDEAQGTLAGALLGTPSYMAPEQAAGRNADVDQRTDVFGIGALLYELLSGRPPYEGPTTVAILAEALQGKCPSIDQLAPRAPASLRAICAKAMAIDPAARYRSAAEVAVALEQALTGAWAEREWSAVRVGAMALTGLAILATAIGFVLMIGVLPALEELGDGRFPIYFCATLAAIFGTANVLTRGRQRLTTMTLVFTAFTAGAGLMSTTLGIMSALRHSAEPAMIADAPRWREYLASRSYESMGNLILGLGLAMTLLLLWAATRRWSTDAPHRETPSAR